VRREVGRNRRARVVDDERQLEQRQRIDAIQTDGRLEREHPAGGDPVDRRRPTGGGDQRLEILDLTLDRVRGRVTALATAPAIVRVDGEVLGEHLGQRAVGPRGAMAEGPIDENDGWAAADLVERDLGSVPRRDHGQLVWAMRMRLPNGSSASQSMP